MVLKQNDEKAFIDLYCGNQIMTVRVKNDIKQILHLD